MENEKMIISCAPGTNEVIIREGKAAPVLEPKAPVKTNLSGTIGTVVEYLTKRINAEQFFWQPAELGLFCKMNRAFFADAKENMTLVTTLMNFKADVNVKMERSIAENGNRTDNFAQVVNSNLPAKFTLKIAIFKGMPAETLEVETFAKVDGREVAFILLSPGANQTLEDLRNKVIDDELAKIKEIAPEIAIIEI